MSLRDEIAYQIYMMDRAEKAAMPFQEFVAYPVESTYIGDCKRAADKILNIPDIRSALQVVEEMKNGCFVPPLLLKALKEKADNWDKAQGLEIP